MAVGCLNKIYDPDRNASSGCFPFKGTDAEGDCQLVAFLEHLRHDIREKMEMTVASIESAA
jgi:hypothetical protein